jgi:hypothetical protein
MPNPVGHPNGHPLTLGAFAVDPDGALQPRQAGLRPALHFAWRGRPCEATLFGASVQLAAIAARIPSTADRSADRGGAFQAVMALRPTLPHGWQARLLPDHQLRLETTAQFAAPPNAIGIIATMVRFALALDPYLDPLDSACGPSPSAGMAKS